MQVKICGLTTPLMMEAALSAGADYVGLVFFPKSPRHVALDLASELAAIARGKARITALVVDPGDELLSSIVTTVRPDYLQLHGSESPARCAAINSEFQLPLIKAIGIREKADTKEADCYDMADLILFDAKADPRITELPGGNGIPFDWQALKGQKEQRDFMLSGGLTPLNVVSAITLTGAKLVDVSSGVETEPGRKDSGLIEAFIRAAKSTETKS